MTRRKVPRPPELELVALTEHVPTWVLDAFVRCAQEQRRTVSSLVAEILEEDCVDDPENPKNQTRQAAPFDIGEPNARGPILRSLFEQRDVGIRPRLGSLSPPPQ
jgi:hypothetical protein